MDASGQHVSLRASRALPSALFLAGSGVAVLLFNGLLLNPFSRIMLAAVAVGWGLWTVIAKPHNRRAGWVSLAAGGVIVLFGSLFQSLANVAGVVLIAAGGIAYLSSLFRRGRGN